MEVQCEDCEKFVPLKEVLQNNSQTYGTTLCNECCKKVDKQYDEWIKDGKEQKETN